MIKSLVPITFAHKGANSKVALHCIFKWELSISLKLSVCLSTALNRNSFLNPEEQQRVIPSTAGCEGWNGITYIMWEVR